MAQVGGGMPAGVTTESTEPWVKWQPCAPSPRAAARIQLVVAMLECKPKVVRAPEFFKRSSGFLYKIALSIKVTNLKLPAVLQAKQHTLLCWVWPVGYIPLGTQFCARHCWAKRQSSQGAYIPAGETDRSTELQGPWLECL